MPPRTPPGYPRSNRPGPGGRAWPGGRAGRGYLVEKQGGSGVIIGKHTIPYPEIPKFQLLVLARSGLEKGSDYGLLKKCQNEKNAVFHGESVPPTPGAKKRQKRPKTAKIQKIAPDLLLGAIYFLGDLL